ncbi:MAG: hypothetical protein QXO16_07270 [Archaeoglobaceae archaeon]
MKVLFDDNIADDSLVCWGVTVRLPKYALFGATREERRKNWEKKLLEVLADLKFGFENVTVRLASAWVRYYVFEVLADRSRFALNVLSPNSPIRDFREIDFPKIENIAKPLAISQDYMLQEWVDGIPLSEFREGFSMKREDLARECIKLTAELLYKIFKLDYIYSPWEDYEAVYSDGKIVLLDLTRFVKRDIGREDFFPHYYGAPFSSPDILVEDERNRIFWRGTSEKDYFGTSREEYEKLFLEGIASVCDDFEEFLAVSRLEETRARALWDRKRY